VYPIYIGLRRIYWPWHCLLAIFITRASIMRHVRSRDTWPIAPWRNHVRRTLASDEDASWDDKVGFIVRAARFKLQPTRANTSLTEERRRRYSLLSQPESRAVAETMPMSSATFDDKWAFPWRHHLNAVARAVSCRRPERRATAVSRRTWRPSFATVLGDLSRTYLALAGYIFAFPFCWRCCRMLPGINSFFPMWLCGPR